MSLLFCILQVAQLDTLNVVRERDYVPGGAEKLLARVYFDFNNSTLTPEAQSILATVAERMLKESTLFIDVDGHADNIGTTFYNLSLSKQRALAVKQYLVKHFKIQEDRVYISGFGVNVPIASNETEDGRQQNRRVDIVVHDPDALLAWFKNQVRVQPPPLIPQWVEPLINHYLYRFYKVKTGRKSSADIQFPGKGGLRMDEEALVIIYGMRPTILRKGTIFDTATERNFELQSGVLRTILNEMSAKDGVVMNTPAAMVKLHSRNSKVTVDNELKTLISIYDGYAEVLGGGEKIIVNKGEGTIIEKGVPPQPPRPLPLPPTKLFRESRYKKIFSAESCPITFKWETTGSSFHLQIAYDPLFRKLLVDTCIELNSLAYSLREGSYYWRVSCIDEAGLEGKFSIPNFFELIMDTIKPPLGISMLDDKRRRDAFLMEGKTESSARVYINRKKVELDTAGRFSYPISRDEKLLQVQVLDVANNLLKYQYRTPQPPSFEWGGEWGVWRTIDTAQTIPWGYYYGGEVTYILWFNSSIYLNGGTGGLTRGTTFHSFKRINSIGLGFSQVFSSLTSLGVSQYLTRIPQ